jgi:hypothetical protein
MSGMREKNRGAGDGENGSGAGSGSSINWWSVEQHFSPLPHFFRALRVQNASFLLSLKSGNVAVRLTRQNYS